MSFKAAPSYEGKIKYFSYIFPGINFRKHFGKFGAVPKQQGQLLIQLHLPVILYVVVPGIRLDHRNGD
jgi:hypothetical protein